MCFTAKSYFMPLILYPLIFNQVKEENRNNEMRCILAQNETNVWLHIKMAFYLNRNILWLTLNIEAGFMRNITAYLLRKIGALVYFF